MHGWILSAVAAFGLVLVPPTTMTAATEDRPVDLELVLAVDSSSSVDSREFALQVEGMAYAFRDPAVQAAIAAGGYGAIAVTLVEWSSHTVQRVNVPWSLVAGPDDAEDLAQMLENAPRLVETGATSLSAALLFSADLFDGNGYEGTRQIVDISGDGYNNHGPVLTTARNAVGKRGIGVNALVIANLGSSLDLYFEREVIIGPGAFVEQAPDYDNYAEAIRRKLLREIRDTPISLVPRSGILQPAESRETVATAKDRR